MAAKKAEQGHNFKRGDLVKVRSGGPAMTVERVIERSNLPSFTLGEDDERRPSIQCTWFSGSKAQSDNFDPDVLVHVSENTKK